MSPQLEQRLGYEAAWDLAQQWVGRWNAHDVEAIIGLVSYDVSWEDPSLERTARGHGEARSYVQSIFRAFPDIAWSMPKGLCLQPPQDGGVIRIAQPWICRGTSLGPTDPPGFAPTGRSFELEGVDLWELRPEDGRLCRVVSHYDGLEFARRVGLMPPRGTRSERALVRLQRVRERLRR